jgi:ABC-type dipeptide/oligopeptide/nickel transport system permease component
VQKTAEFTKQQQQQQQQQQHKTKNQYGDNIPLWITILEFMNNNMLY